MSHCTTEDTSALLEYTFSGDPKKSVRFTGGLPIDVQISNINKEKFNSDGSKPINYIAPGNITSITCTGTFRQIGNDPSTELPCTYVIDRAVINGNNWTSDYDSIYSDNTGNMVFTTSYISEEDIIRVYRGNELIFKDVGKAPVTFKVECIREKCPEGYCECKSSEYPGYCCLNCSSTAAKLHALTEQVRGING